MAKKIGIRVVKTELINWRELQLIQQDNFKEIPEEVKHKLKASLIGNDFIQPFYVWQSDDGLFCLDGKHRTLFLEELISEGFDVPYQLPATFVECRDKKEAARLVLVFSSAYAKITQTGLNDFITLNDIEWSEIKGVIDLPEFSTERFEQKFDHFGIKDENGEDDDPDFDQSEPTIIKTGDFFQLNEHRLICGSFTDPEIVSLLMDGQKARIVICDPPYNLPANFFTNTTEKNRHKNFAMGAGEMDDEEFMLFLKQIMDVSIANTVAGSIHYIFMDHRHVWHMTEAGKQAYGNPKPKQMITWVKDIMANGSFYRAQQELCFVFSDDKAKALFNGDLLTDGGFYRSESELCFIFKNEEKAKHLSHLELKDRIRTNVWRYPSGASRANPDRDQLKNHPTPKPVAMIADAILDTTNERDIVIDWFLGSGTSLIGSDKTNRTCYGTEIEPSYVQHIIRRYKIYCDKIGKEFRFKHLNGNINIDQIIQTTAAV